MNRVLAARLSRLEASGPDRQARLFVIRARHDHHDEDVQRELAALAAGGRAASDRDTLVVINIFAEPG